MRARLIEETYGEVIAEFVQAVRVEYLAGLQVPAEHVQKLGPKTSGGTAKGGRPPIDYTAVEMLVDLRQAVKQGVWKEAYTMWIYLRRITNL
jgi:hypothetical protein